jgi:hypothetical protein
MIAASRSIQSIDLALCGPLPLASDNILLVCTPPNNHQAIVRQRPL